MTPLKCVIPARSSTRSRAHGASSAAAPKSVSPRQPASVSAPAAGPALLQKRPMHRATVATRNRSVCASPRRSASDCMGAGSTKVTVCQTDGSEQRRSRRRQVLAAAHCARRSPRRRITQKISSSGSESSIERRDIWLLRDIQPQQLGCRAGARVKMRDEFAVHVRNAALAEGWGKTRETRLNKAQRSRFFSQRIGS